jgi:hypothetical protein
MHDDLSVPDEWRESGDLTIYEAAFWLRLNSDPRVYEYLVEHDPDNTVDLSERGLDIEIWEKCAVLRSVIRAGIIKVTQERLKADGELDCRKTHILKTDWLTWCDANGYDDLAARFQKSPIASTANARFNQTEPEYGGGDSSANDSRPQNEDDKRRHYAELAASKRGCQALILDRWVDIRKIYSQSVNGRALYNFFNKQSPRPEPMPSVKTFQNSIKLLRDEGVLT